MLSLHIRNAVKIFLFKPLLETSVHITTQICTYVLKKNCNHNFNVMVSRLKAVFYELKLINRFNNIYRSGTYIYIYIYIYIYNPQHAFLQRGVKPSVLCRRFAACKRSLNLCRSRNLGKITGQISRLQFHLSLIGSLASLRTYRHLAAKVGTSKGGEKQWQTTPKNLPRMQCARAIPVT